MKTFIKYLKKTCKALLVIFLLFILILTIFHIVTVPSNTRNWNEDQTLLPYADISGNEITIHNIRNFNYATTTVYTKAYYDKTYDLESLKKVWYIVEPFSGIPGSAHTFLSFEFEDNVFLSVSVEIRKEKGESFNPIIGLFSQYEIMYLWSDERDVIKLRSNYRQDKVFVYPIKADIEKARTLFTDMIKRTNHLANNPEFYNTVTNTCTTNIVRHVDAVTPGRVPYLSLSVLLPASSDKLAYRLGLLETDLSFEEARKRFYINDRALKYADDEDFSVRIREEENRWQ